jgi:hypothetical protein
MATIAVERYEASIMPVISARDLLAATGFGWAFSLLFHLLADAWAADMVMCYTLGTLTAAAAVPFSILHCLSRREWRRLFKHRPLGPYRTVGYQHGVNCLSPMPWYPAILRGFALVGACNAMLCLIAVVGTRLLVDPCPAQNELTIFQLAMLSCVSTCTGLGALRLIRLAEARAGASTSEIESGNGYAPLVEYTVATDPFGHV